MLPMTPHMTDAAAYLLGQMGPEQVVAFEAVYRSDPDARAAVSAWRAYMDRLNDGMQPADLPEDLQEELDRQMSADRNQPLWRRLDVVTAILGAAAAAGLLLLALDQGWLVASVTGQ